MRSLAVCAALLALSLAACGSSEALPSASASVAPTAASAQSTATILELVDTAGPLPAGRYAPPGSRPDVTFAVADGWSGGPARDASLAISHPLADGAVVELRLAAVDGVIDATGATTDADDAAAATERLQDRQDLEVTATSISRMSGLEGENLELANSSGTRLDLLTAGGGRLGIEPGGRLWLSLFDTGDGLLAIAVTSPAASWDEALGVVEPVLESVTID